MADYGRRYVYKQGKVILGPQDFLNMDTFTREFFQASVLTDLVSGSMSAQLEYTMDDMDDMTVDTTTFRWFPWGNVMTATTLLEINTPISGLRLNIGMITGEVRFTVLQGISH